MSGSLAEELRGRWPDPPTKISAKAYGADVEMITVNALQEDPAVTVDDWNSWSPARPSIPILSFIDSNYSYLSSFISADPTGSLAPRQPARAPTKETYENGAMTRDEIDLKLQLIEERMDARLQRMETAYEGQVKRTDEFIERIERASERANQQVVDGILRSKQEASDTRKELFKDLGDAVDGAMDKVKDSNKSLKWTIIGTAIATVLALGGLEYALKADGWSAYQAGSGIQQSIQTAADKAANDAAAKVRAEQPNGDSKKK
ncbi:hypothetical protein SAMN02800692_1546 [Luteibacter sp. UNC138MFCol5.1]|nr:hypothetical protein SAMN02800692_1546 [Luteibacter sp. UNC138MFCol5.1]